MFAICKREFLFLFKSIKSIIFIVIISGLILIIAEFLSNIPLNILKEMGVENEYVLGLMLLIYFLGPLLVISLSHDTINKEEQNRTLRFLIPKINRDEIVLGKYTGILSFWSICLFLALLIISIFAKKFYWLPFIESIVFLSYFISLSIFLSICIGQSSITLIIGIILSLIIPIIGLISLLTKKYLFINLISILTPYYYFSFPDKPMIEYLTIIPSILILLISILVFRKKDY